LTQLQALLPEEICEAPPDLGRIVFQSLRDGNTEIYVMNADGSDQRNLTENLASDTTPTWLPDGVTIGFSSDRDGDQDIYEMSSVDGSGLVNRSTSNSTDLSWPSWSPPDEPGGAKIAFDLVNSLGRDIYVMNADGSAFSDGARRKNLTNDPSNLDTMPSWSPNGTKIAFATARDGDFEIYVMDVLTDMNGIPFGANPVNLSRNAALDSGPAWSPDGAKIAFWSDRGGNRDIYIMNADGTGQERLTFDPATDSSPSWSPDGTMIAFRSQRDGDSEIFVMEAVPGAVPQQLTFNTASDLNPRWSPPPLSP
jgi:Tol biopolymer transport system component